MLVEVLVLAALVAVPVASAAKPTVAVYQSSTSGVLDPFWDPNGLPNLHLQLRHLGINAAGVAKGPKDPQISGTRPAAFIIPAISGDTLYSDAEDVSQLTALVNAGGLVVLHGSARHPDAAQDLVASILGYQGAWLKCEPLTDNTRSGLGEAAVSSHAQSFLPGPWPPILEDVRTVQVHSWCKHEDSAAVSYPLYTIGGDSMKAVAQAFTRVGTPGSVLWLGYSWQSGPQPGWGALLDQVIAAFYAGTYQPPPDAALMDAYPLALDAAAAVAEAVAALVDETSEAIRRLLYGVVFPYANGAGYYSGGGYYGGYYGGSPVPLATYPPTSDTTIPSPSLPPALQSPAPRSPPAAPSGIQPFPAPAAPQPPSPGLPGVPFPLEPTVFVPPSPSPSPARDIPPAHAAPLSPQRAVPPSPSPPSSSPPPPPHTPSPSPTAKPLSPPPPSPPHPTPAPVPVPSPAARPKSPAPSPPSPAPTPRPRPLRGPRPPPSSPPPSRPPPRTLPSPRPPPHLPPSPSSSRPPPRNPPPSRPPPRIPPSPRPPPRLPPSPTPSRPPPRTPPQSRPPPHVPPSPTLSRPPPRIPPPSRPPPRIPPSPPPPRLPSSPPKARSPPPPRPPPRNIRRLGHL